MIARVAVWEPMPDDDRQWVIDAAKTVPGVLDTYHLVDPDTGNGLSIAFFDDDVEVAHVKPPSPERQRRSAGMGRFLTSARPSGSRQVRAGHGWLAALSHMRCWE